MTIDPKFLNAVQSKGWLIKAVGEKHVLAGCPRHGCGLKVQMAPGKVIPEACKDDGKLEEAEVRTFDDARLFLRERREDLAMTIRETEEVAGIAGDFLAKFEKDDPSKIPNAQTFIEWAQALGYVVTLRPAKLSSYAIAVIAGTRHRLGARLRQTLHHRSKRGGASRS